MKEYQAPFLGYVEDDPTRSWKTKFDVRADAVAVVRTLVANRMRKNGAGWGAVLDDDMGEILCCEGDLPPEADDPQWFEGLADRIRAVF